MVRLFFWLCVLAIITGAGYWSYQHVPEVTRCMDRLRDDGPMCTFETRWAPDTLVQQHQKELASTPGYTLEPGYTVFVPHMLMKVKYAPDGGRTQESELLWSLLSGEMILDTASFESTRGFEDCIRADATPEDFRILHAILQQGGKSTREALLQTLGTDFDALSSELARLQKKHLITIQQGVIRLHFQENFLSTPPRTYLQHTIVLQTPSDKLLPARYSKDAIRKVATAAFGQNFAIRSDETVYVPYIVLEIKNPDTSTLRTYWNAVTGRRCSL